MRVEAAAPAGRSHGRLSAIDYREAAGDFMERTEPDTGKIAAGLDSGQRSAVTSAYHLIRRVHCYHEKGNAPMNLSGAFGFVFTFSESKRTV